MIPSRSSNFGIRLFNAVTAHSTPKAHYSSFKEKDEAFKKRHESMLKKMPNLKQMMENNPTEMAKQKKITHAKLNPFYKDNGVQSVKSRSLTTFSKELKSPLNEFELNQHQEFVGEEGVTFHFHDPLSSHNTRQLHSYQNALISNREKALERFEKFTGLHSSNHNGAVPLIPQNLEEADLNEIQVQHQLSIERNKKFKSSISQIVNSRASNFDIATKLETFIYGKDSKGVERFNAQELKSLLMELWDVEAYDLIVELMENSKNSTFVQNPINLEFYAKAILKGSYFNIFNAEAVAENLLSRTPQCDVEALALFAVIEAIKKNSAKKMLKLMDSDSCTNLSEIKTKNLSDLETITLYQCCFPDSSGNRKDVLDEYETSLSNSLIYSEEAFELSYDCRHACRSLHRILEQNNEAEIEKWVNLTRMAALKEGGLKSNNIAVIRSYLESLYCSSTINLTEIKLAEKTLLCLMENEHQITDSLASLNDLLLPKEASARVEKFKQKLNRSLVEMQKPDFYESSSIKLRKEKLKSTRSDWDNFTYGYKGVNSNFVEGNFKFGAQLPTHHVNRHDREFFSEILNLPFSKILKNLEDIPDPNKTLEEISDFEEFNVIIDRMIRESFHTDELGLEQLDSAGHKSFDETVQGLNALYGGSTKEARKLMPDSRTNISTNIILGLGDCRHHSQVKQILFDEWHGYQMDKITFEITNLQKSDSLLNEAELKSKLIELDQIYQGLLQKELRTFDCEVHLPIQLKDGYPVWKDGHMVKDPQGKYKKVEEHTMNVELNYDQSLSNVENVVLRDAFYQTTYPWKSQTINNPEKLLSEGVTGGRIEVLNEATGQLETIVINLRPAGYAGSKEKYDRGTDEAYCIGLPVQKLNFNQAKEKSGDIQNYLSKVREWHTK